MSITKIGIRFGAKLPRIESFKRFLFVGPHPDDIEIGAGATIKRLADEGKNIAFLICTDGRYGDGFVGTDVSREELIAMRKEESIASAKYLGVSDVRFLDLSDGAFYQEEELLKGIIATISDFNPDIIFGPDYFVASETHPDHLRVGNAVKTAAFIAPYQGIMEQYGAEPADVQAVAYYMTAKPNRYVKTKGLKDQLRALKLHKSQYPEGSNDYDSIKLYLTLRNIDASIRTMHFGAEGFRVLGKTHMHCLPEAGL